MECRSSTRTAVYPSKPKFCGSQRQKINSTSLKPKQSFSACSLPVLSHSQCFSSSSFCSSASSYSPSFWKPSKLSARALPDLISRH